MKAQDLKHNFHKILDQIFGTDEVAQFFYMSVEHHTGITKTQLALTPDLTLDTDAVEKLKQVLDGLAQQKPIQYILGETDFYGLKFKVNPYVLIPRPETEELVDLIITSVKLKAKSEINSDTLSALNTCLKPLSSIASTQHPITILDIGTGSGCIAVSLAKHLPNSKVFALDISEKALAIAKQNASLNKVDITFINADILDTLGWDLFFQNLKFNIIVSNPPYVRHIEKKDIQPNVLNNEPHLALFVDDNNPLVFYKAIIQFAIKNLKPNGQLFFEINQYLGKNTKQLLVDENFTNVKLQKDLNGNDRMLSGSIPANSTL